MSTEQARARLTGMGMRVTPENVLRLHNALHAEVARLQALFQQHQHSLRVGECGLDPLSHPVAELFNHKIQAHLHATTTYINELDGARDACHQMALSYGHSESEIAQSFEVFNRDVMPGIYAQVADDRRVRDLIHGQPGLAASTESVMPGGVR